MTNKPALVFGASGEQGRAVIEGLVEAGYRPVYGFTRSVESTSAELTYLKDALGCQLYQGDIANPVDVENALRQTEATAIFLTTTTELPSEIGQGCWNAMEAEVETIQIFFDTLLKVYKQDGIPRHVIFSTKDNVQALWRTNDKLKQDIIPMDDGSIVPHYSAKGKGAEYALKLLQDTPDLTLTLLTLPFVYSNFLGFFTPLPVDDKDDNHTHQWQISASLGDGTKPIDMMSVSDLSTIVPNVLQNKPKFQNVNLRLSACQISMDQIAAHFSDLFGKDVIYNPLTPQEVAALPHGAAPAMAQMGQYLQQAPPHDLPTTAQLLYPKRPQQFQDWLLTHSDSSAFEKVGLDRDAPEINSVVVFGATSPQGVSVIKGLLKDNRKQYTVRAATNDESLENAIHLKQLDPERVEVVYANLDDVESCQKAAEGVEGAFLVTDFYSKEVSEATELQHAKNVIDACEKAHSIQHLVFSTMDNVEEMNQHFQMTTNNNSNTKPATNSKESSSSSMNAKAKAAAYARTKKLSVTYVILPCYSELFLDMIKKYPAPSASPTGVDDNASGSSSEPAKHEKLVLTVPVDKDSKVMCMSVDDLGPAVSNIFDSYQVYAGHEIGLVTDFVTVAEICDALNAVSGTTVETKTVTKEEWIRVASDSAYMKDMGQIFAFLSHSDAVQKRHSIAKTLKLVPSPKPLKQWVEQNKDNPSFREKLGLR